MRLILEVLQYYPRMIACLAINTIDAWSRSVEHSYAQSGKFQEN